MDPRQAPTGAACLPEDCGRGSGVLAGRDVPPSPWPAGGCRGRAGNVSTSFDQQGNHPPLQPRIDRLALQGQDTEHAFVNAPQGLTAREALQPFDPEGELPQGERALPRQPALAEALQVLGQRVLGAVDDPQVLPPPALERRLRDPPPAAGTE